MHKLDGDRNTIERALRCRGLIIEYVKRGPWKSTCLLEDSSNTGGKISDSQVEDVGALFSAVCIGIVCSPSTAVPGLGGGTLTIAGDVGLVSLGSRVLKRICAFAFAGTQNVGFLPLCNVLLFWI